MLQRCRAFSAQLCGQGCEELLGTVSGYGELAGCAVSVKFDGVRSGAPDSVSDTTTRITATSIAASKAIPDTMKRLIRFDNL